MNSPNNLYTGVNHALGPSKSISYSLYLRIVGFVFFFYNLVFLKVFLFNSAKLSNVVILNSVFIATEVPGSTILPSPPNKTNK